ncbi:MAG: HU family DNA-binding protein [Bacteroidetes bacterium]|nr:HU family DNA-binding protein [Bacteroidota bacterium]MBT7093402.1 HU family DNA-binding protein [Bacteroidota bacterium]MBT7466434.1 HU family DNA-binding protein [Bacteroidota bacterium]
MTYQELVDKIAEKTGRPKNLVDKLIHEMIRTTTEGLQQDQHITVRGLGRYRLKWTKARQGRNPQTGDPIEIAAHNRILFKPNVSLREFINREYAHLKPELLEEQKEQPAEALKQLIRRQNLLCKKSNLLQKSQRQRMNQKSRR